jgi:PAS domain-containing protein
MKSAQLCLEQVGNVLETLNQGVIINDERKQIVFANSKFLEMIKMSGDDLLGQLPVPPAEQCGGGKR